MRRRRANKHRESQRAKEICRAAVSCCVAHDETIPQGIDRPDAAARVYPVFLAVHEAQYNSVVFGDNHGPAKLATRLTHQLQLNCA